MGRECTSLKRNKHPGEREREREREHNFIWAPCKELPWCTSLFMKAVDLGRNHWLRSVNWKMTVECRARIIAAKMFWRHPSDLQSVNTSSLDDHNFFDSSWQSSFVGALHLSAFESLRIGKSPNSCVYENTSFQEPAVNLYLVQAAQCISLPGSVPLRKLSMEVCPPLVSTVPTDWFSL